MSDQHDPATPAPGEPIAPPPPGYAQPTQQVPAGQPGQPPEGYGYQGGYAQQPAQQPAYGAPAPGAAPAAAPAAGAAAGAGVKVGLPMLLGLASIVAIVLAVSLKEDGSNGWDRIGVWGGFAIACAAVTLVPSLRSNLNLDAAKAWRVGAAGAIGLAAFWVLFVLPSIEQNVSFLATLGVLAGAAAVAMAPGRPDAPSASGPGQSW